MSGPAQVPGPTVAPSAWASVRLIQGSSKANQWQIDSSTNRAQLTVGADVSCDWPVAAGGVAPIHFELFWDGRRLWIADTREVGGVTIDGARLSSWQPITGRARIEFGTAAMLAECSLPAVSSDLEPTRRPGDAVPGDDERTTLHVRPDTHGPHGKADDRVPLHAAPTTIAELPDGAQPYGGPPAMPPGSGMSPPAILHPMKPSSAMPTIILDGGATPDPGRLPPGMLAKPGPGGNPAMRPGMGMATPDPGMVMRGGMGGMGMQTPDPAAAMRPGMPMGMGPATPAGTRPTWMNKLGLPQTSIPPRTWGLVILTVGALMIVMFMGGGNDSEQPQRRVASKGKQTAAATGEGKAAETQPAETKPAETKPAETKPGETETAESKPGETKTAETKPAENKTAETKPAENKTAETKPAENKTAETKPAEKQPAAAEEPAAGAASATAAQGADLLLAGRQREAIAVYDELARMHPDQPVHAAIVKILKRRLADRCRDKQPGESPCPPAQ